MVLWAYSAVRCAPEGFEVYRDLEQDPAWPFPVAVALVLAGAYSESADMLARLLAACPGDVFVETEEGERVVTRINGVTTAHEPKWFPRPVLAA